MSIKKMESIRYKLRASESLFKVAQPVSSTPLLSSVKKRELLGKLMSQKRVKKSVWIYLGQKHVKCVIATQSIPYASSK